MRSGRETFVLALAAFLTGMVVTLIAYQFGAGELKGLKGYLTLSLILLLVAALFLLWWKLASVADSAGASQGTVTVADWKPSSQTWREDPPMPAKRGGEGIRESGGTGALPPTIGGERQPGSRSASQVTRTLKPPAASSGLYAQPGSWQDNDLPSSPRVDSSRLIDIWDSYYRNGDGRFNASGLRRQLENAGIGAEVIPGERIGGGDNILALDLQDHSGVLYLLPNFTKPPRAIEEWFEAADSGSRMARIQRLVRPATARKSGGTINLVSKGEVE